MIKINKPVFIFSIHRSGSTYLKNIIDSSNEVKMLEHEVHFDHPFFLNTFRKYYNKICEDQINKYDAFLETLNKKKIQGDFWAYYKNNYGDFYQSKKYLPDIGNITIWKSFNSILKQVLSYSDKERIGIKYPVHYKYFEYFYKQYQDPKNIFLIRDPRAIVASKILSPTNKRLKNRGWVAYKILRFITVIYISLEFKYFLKKILRNKANGFVVKYEDLVQDNYNQIKNICSFAQISWNPKMQNATGQKSGYGETKNSKDRMDRWKKVLKNHEVKIINTITNKNLKQFGYA